MARRVFTAQAEGRWPLCWPEADCSVDASGRDCGRQPAQKRADHDATGDRCNIAGAARALGVPASDLRRLVTWGPLAAAVTEAVEQAIDRAEAVLLEGLESSDVMVRLKAASALLTLSPAGRRRGFGRSASTGRKTRPTEDVTLKWRDS
jgi:hypothetical protein